MTIRRTPIALALIAGLALAPMLSGCANPVRSVVDRVTGGNVDLGGSELPASFPKNVPLYNDDITVAVALGNDEDGRVWNVSLRVKKVDDVDRIEAQLEKAGFEPVEGSDLVKQTSQDGRTIALQDDSYGVVVVVVTTNGDTIANYSVTELDQK